MIEGGRPGGAKLFGGSQFTKPRKMPGVWMVGQEREENAWKLNLRILPARQRLSNATTPTAAAIARISRAIFQKL